MTKIFLVEDHPLFRMGIRQSLAAYAEFTVVGEAGNARDAFAAIDTHPPDIVVMDVSLPGMDGVIATREIRRRAPGTRVLLLSVHDQISDVLEALDAGAAGLRAQDGRDRRPGGGAADDRPERSLRGAPVWPRSLGSYESRRKKPLDALSILSLREREVFRLAADCLLTREIARELCISRKTVDTHLYRIHRKLGLRTSAELVGWPATWAWSGAGARAKCSPASSAAEPTARARAQGDGGWLNAERQRVGQNRDIVKLIRHELNTPLATALLYIGIAEGSAAGLPEGIVKSALRVAAVGGTTAQDADRYPDRARMCRLRNGSAAIDRRWRDGPDDRQPNGRAPGSRSGSRRHARRSARVVGSPDGRADRRKSPVQRLEVRSGTSGARRGQAGRRRHHDRGPRSRHRHRGSEPGVGSSSGNAHAPPEQGGGLGLGLWLVRELAAAHGGWVTLESRKGHGATFTVFLRARRPTAAVGAMAVPASPPPPVGAPPPLLARQGGEIAHEGPVAGPQRDRRAGAHLDDDVAVARPGS